MGGAPINGDSPQRKRGTVPIYPLTFAREKGDCPRPARMTDLMICTASAKKGTVPFFSGGTA